VRHCAPSNWSPTTVCKILAIDWRIRLKKTYLTFNPFKQLPRARLGVIPPKVMEFGDIEQLDCALMIEIERHQTAK
jgi:hypothetical protein